MFLVDYIIIFIIFTSVLFGIIRGFIKELISFLFWFLSFFLINKYYYFSSFYIDFLQNSVLKNKILIGIMFCFLIIKQTLNYFLRKIILKINLYYFNIILGSLFGFFRGITIVFFLLLILKYFNEMLYDYYIKNSFFIFIFLQQPRC